MIHRAMFKRIDHIELLTAAPERAVEFYTGTLGFRVRERMRVPQTPQGPLDLVYLELGGTTLEVMCFPDAKHAIPPRVANGPQRSIRTRTVSAPSPVTIAESVIVAPGRVCCALTRVSICGCETTAVVSAASVHSV